MLPTAGARRHLCVLASAVCLLGAATVFAQSRAAEEALREEWQKVGEIFAAMGVRPGATVADVGAGDGFFSSRLAKAVGPAGLVYAVDVSDRALERLRKRLDEDAIRNVVVVKGNADDPKLPEHALDAALIVNAYHEMPEHQAILSAVRRALKPDGRLVIVEPITDSKRARSREDQVRDHEIAPEFVLHDARAAGFRIVGLQDPFTTRERGLEWLVALQPAKLPAAPAPDTDVPPAEIRDDELNDPELRVAPDEFRRLVSSGAVTVVDVRDAESFVNGHIPGALSVPLESIDGASEQLRALGTPVVTYCS